VFASNEGDGSSLQEKIFFFFSEKVKQKVDELG